MENNINTQTNINSKPISGKGYADSKGTGALSTLIFTAIVTIIMIVLAYFKGS